MSLPPHVGPLELLVGVPRPNGDRRTRKKASGMSGSPQQQLLGCEYLIWSQFQSFLTEREGGFGGGF